MAGRRGSAPASDGGILGRIGRLLGGRRAAFAEAEALLAQHRWSAADRVFETILRRAPDDPDALQGRARAAASLWRFGRAAEFAARAAALRPADPALHALHAEALLLTGDHAGAIARFAAALAAGGGRRLGAEIATIEGERANIAVPDRPTVLVTFSTPAFVAAQTRLAASAVAAGRIAATIEWTSERLRETAFYAAHRDVLDDPRGAGCWAWKPYLILSAFDAVPEGGYVVYSDCGRGDGYLFRQSVAPVVRWCEATGTGALPGVYLPAHGRNAAWTRRDCFVRMGCDGEAFWDAPQIQATYSVWRHDARNRAFVERWLGFCTDRAIVSDDANVSGLPDLPDFREHRHDQSVLTNLCIAEGRPAFGRPEQRTQRSKDINAIINRVRAAGF